MDTLFADVRFALRQLARSPGFAAVAIVTLALGIGANTALYSLADGILVRARPGVRDAGGLTWIAATSNVRDRPVGLSIADADRVRREVPQLTAVATIRAVDLSMVTRGEPLTVKAQAVSGEYFGMLRTPMALGRAIRPADDHGEGAHPVAVLNYQAWQTSFGADSAIIGTTITLNALPFTVIGVAAPEFNGAEHDTDLRAVWVPLSMLTTLSPMWRAMLDDPRSSNFRVLARLRDGEERTSIAPALARLGSVIAAGDSARPAGWRLRAYDASAGLPAGGDRQVAPLAALSLAVTGLVLLICCANVSNLMLARAVGREREISTRLSIGASRWRVVRQLLTESIILSLVASVAGILIATWGTSLLVATAFPLHLDLSVDWRVFAVSAALALGAGLLFGLAPALHATRRDVATALRAAATGGGERKSHLQGSLVVAQVALSLMLLTMSGLFIRALDKARRLDVGFDASPRVLALSYDVGLQRYDSARADAFHAQLMARVRALPGVQRVAATDLLPLTEWSAAPVVTELAGQRSGESPNEDRESRLASISAVGVEYFGTIDTPILAGRSFTEGDRAGALPVAIVSEGFARQRFGTASPLGGRVRVAAGDSSWWTIVGVARDAVIQSLQAPPAGAIYFPLPQRPSPSLSVLIRTTGANAAALERAVRAQVRALDPTLPIRRLTTLDQVRDAATSEQRAGATVLAIFGALALALAALGLHAVLVFLVRQRTREIGIRMALGASRGAVTTLVVRRGLQLTAIGVVVGVLMALGATQLTRSLLFGISPTDGWTFVATAVLFMGVAALACWLPARRAARVDPVMAIRAE